MSVISCYNCSLPKTQWTYLCERKSPSSDSLHLNRSMGLSESVGDSWDTWDTGEMGKVGREVGMGGSVLDMIMVAMVVAKAGSDNDGSLRAPGRTVATAEGPTVGILATSGMFGSGQSPWATDSGAMVKDFQNTSSLENKSKNS